MRLRYLLLGILAALSMGSTGCMMMEPFDDNGSHEAEYRRELPRTATEKTGAYGGTD